MYATADLAAIAERRDNDRAIYVVDASQTLHFEQVRSQRRAARSAAGSLRVRAKKVFALARKCGLYDPDKIRVEHVGFGVMQGSDGRKFSTRAGKGMPLRDLLDLARERAAAARHDVQKQARDGNPAAAALDDDAINEKIGIASVKYFDLRHDWCAKTCTACAARFS